MKTANQQMKLFKYFAIMNLMFSPIVLSAHAQDRSGNGGDPNEVAEFTGRNGEQLSSWYSVKQDLIKGFQLDQHRSLNLNGISPEEFKEKALLALSTVKVEFKKQEIEIDGVSRTCKNLVENGVAKIECDSNLYVQMMADLTSEEQYKFIAHEYLGAAGLENNLNGSSDYPYSSQISKNLKLVKVKKWAIANSEAVLGIQCELEFDRTALKKDRRIIIQAHEGAARLIVSEGISKLRNESLKVLNDIRGYGVAQGTQMVFDLKSSDKFGGFIKFTTENEIASGTFKLEISPEITLAMEVSTSDKLDWEDTFYLYTKKYGKLTGYNVRNARCKMINFRDADFKTRTSYMVNALDENEKSKFLLDTLKWLEQSSHKNSYLSTPARSPIQ